MRTVCIMGKSNTRKTTVIRMTYDMLKKDAKTIIEIKENEENENYDIVAVLQIKGINIGFISGGDKANRQSEEDSNGIRENFEFIKGKGCKMLLCACRTRGATLERICDIARPDLVLVRKPFLETGKELKWFDYDRYCHEINEMTANYLANRIREFVNRETQ